MDRLTERWCAGGIRIKGCSTLYPDVDRKSAPMASAIARLAAYEDAMPLERVQELAQAEKDGRLVVLPCNDPLTLEELREIYTTDPHSCLLKLVWIEIKRDMPYSLGNRCSGYDLIGIDDSYPDFAISICDRFLHMKSYGEYWIAYLRKPEWATRKREDTPK